MDLWSEQWSLLPVWRPAEEAWCWRPCTAVDLGRSDRPCQWDGQPTGQTRMVQSASWKQLVQLRQIKGFAVDIWNSGNSAVNTSMHGTNSKKLFFISGEREKKVLFVWLLKKNSCTGVVHNTRAWEHQEWNKTNLLRNQAEKRKHANK